MPMASARSFPALKQGMIENLWEQWMRSGEALRPSGTEGAVSIAKPNARPVPAGARRAGKRHLRLGHRDEEPMPPARLPVHRAVWVGPERTGMLVRRRRYRRRVDCRDGAAGYSRHGARGRRSLADPAQTPIIRQRRRAVPGLTETIAAFIAETRIEDAPAGADEKGKKVLADTFAAMLAGVGSEVAEPLKRYLEESRSTGTSPILGTALTASPEVAAMINGTFGHSLDFDDVLPIMPGHPSVTIMGAVLPTLDREPISGRRLLDAHRVGVEVGAKIGVAMTMGHYDRGFHATGTLGIFSALAALCRLHRLDRQTIRIAFGIAASMASGLRRNFGTMTKPLH
ncbi:MAG: hypothetical protein EHM59_15615, partial [Betaproteobacteria bacterium]